MRSLIQSRRRQGHPRRYVFIPDGEVAVTVSNCTSALQGSRRTTEYPSQFANYLGNPGLYKKSFEWENSI